MRHIETWHGVYYRIFKVRPLSDAIPLTLCGIRVTDGILYTEYKEADIDIAEELCPVCSLLHLAEESSLSSGTFE